MLPKQCSGCSLAATAQGFCPPQEPTSLTKLVVWGEAPGATEIESGIGFTGRSGALLREWLHRLGLKDNEIAFRNVVLCKRPGNKFPSDEEARECLRRHQPETIATATSIQTPPTTCVGTVSSVPWVAYGANAIRVLTRWKAKLVGSPRHPGERGSLLPRDGGWLTAGIHPSYLVRGGGVDNPNKEEGKGQDELKPLLGVDAQRALANPVPRVPLLECVLEPPRSPTSFGKGEVVSVDIEGSNGRPNIVGVAWQEDIVYVCDWSMALRGYLSALFSSGALPVFHNAAFDVAELAEAGIAKPKTWLDTINLAALYDPDQPMNLQWQVLTHVPGTCAWKGLVDHENGPDYTKGEVSSYRVLWTSILSRLARPIPFSGGDWYKFYNGLDTAWGLALYNNLERKLRKQGRWDYYTGVMSPLQAPLLNIGDRGMPVDEAKVAEHITMCSLEIGKRNSLLAERGSSMIALQCKALQDKVGELEANRTTERASGSRKFSRATDLSALRAKLKSAEKGFNPSSNPQRGALLYGYYGLPGSGTDETTLLELISRLERGTIKPKQGTKDEVVEVLQAMMDIGKWKVLKSTFLNPELR